MKNIKSITVMFIIAIVIALVIFQKKEGHKEEMNMETYTGNMEPRIGYVELKVSNLDQSLTFYRQLIGFQVLERDDKTAKLTTDGLVPQLLLIEEETYVERPLRTTGLYHFAIVVPTRQDLALSTIHLIENNYPIQGASDHQYSEAVYLADPDNNGIEIYVDRDSNQWKRDGNGGYVGATDALDVEGLFAEIKDKTWTGLPRGTRIGHMHLQVSDIEESEKFYVEALGFQIVAKETHMLFVSKDEYHHHIGMNIWAGKELPAPPKNALGLKYFTFHLTEEEYDRAKENLGRLGFNYSEGQQEMFVEDPSGNTIKFLIKN
ncbi:VOC family protein [Halalkalibacter akibai]|uniref:Glyoxalase family protein n=1 Tax=Halalkalibacter akibai (strain ATCC 43226 / DSM 21942 / CIP 109018 / JCM 9157 / 1139) TaxID=1236973 RepID=W4QWK5_HALA3|nr:VOC family protein [Halalkalibacter akibai]GAE36292.1 glyoxalase family protein [Halalkalibacter akibai JCM 9157]